LLAYARVSGRRATTLSVAALPAMVVMRSVAAVPAVLAVAAVDITLQAHSAVLLLAAAEAEASAAGQEEAVTVEATVAAGMASRRLTEALQVRLPLSPEVDTDSSVPVVVVEEGSEALQVVVVAAARLNLVAEAALTLAAERLLRRASVPFLPLETRPL
jgi:hypothetical protein